MSNEANSKDPLVDNQLPIWQHSASIDQYIDEQMSVYEPQMEAKRKEMLDQVKQ